MSKNDKEIINWFAIGDSNYKKLISLVFYAGLAFVLYYAYKLGTIISMVFPLTSNLLGVDGYVSTFTERPNSLFGIIGGIVFFLIGTIIWKLICELLLLIFESLHTYLDSRSEHSKNSTQNE